MRRRWRETLQQHPVALVDAQFDAVEDGVGPVAVAEVTPLASGWAAAGRDFAGLDPDAFRRSLDCLLRRVPTVVVIAHVSRP